MGSTVSRTSTYHPMTSAARFAVEPVRKSRLEKQELLPVRHLLICFLVPSRIRAIRGHRGSGRRRWQLRCERSNLASAIPCGRKLTWLLLYSVKLPSHSETANGPTPAPSSVRSCCSLSHEARQMLPSRRVSNRTFRRRLGCCEYPDYRRVIFGVAGFPAKLGGRGGTQRGR